MTENLTAICYLISAIFFILALKGLSNPESARNGNVMWIIGMVIAIITTLNNPNVDSVVLIVLGIIIGGLSGPILIFRIANRITVYTQEFDTSKNEDVHRGKRWEIIKTHAWRGVKGRREAVSIERTRGYAYEA